MPGLIINVDGGSRGNPGPAGAGVVIRTDQGQRIHEGGYFLGRQTNNTAEYHALLRALQRVVRLRDSTPEPPASTTIFSDSELLVRQLTGEYQVKSPTLGPLFREAQMLLVRLGRWTVRHVPREQNSRADELANLAMDHRRDVVVFDVDQAVPQSGDAAQGNVAGSATEATRAASDAGLEEVPIDAGASVGPAVDAAMPAGPRSGQAIRVTISHAPRPGKCPAGGFHVAAFTIGMAVPTGLCVHAAHALIPTVLAMLNTDPEEFAAVPTLTVRCAGPDCGAEFKLSPVRARNGAHR